jgi:hypothetical protein
LLFFNICQSFTFIVPSSTSSAFKDDILRVYGFWWYCGFSCC